MSQVKIDCTQIPCVEVNILCSTLVAAMERFYSDPENCRRFEEWKKQRGEMSQACEEQSTQ